MFTSLATKLSMLNPIKLPLENTIRIPNAFKKLPYSNTRQTVEYRQQSNSKRQTFLILAVIFLASFTIITNILQYMEARNKNQEAN